jgi:hypothetical protein
MSFCGFHVEAVLDLCRRMCPLSVAVERGRWFLISAGVSPGMMVSSSLRSSALRGVTDGGEHMNWWMWRAYSAADDVASTLAAMAKVGAAVGGVWSMEPGGFAAWESWALKGIIHRPVWVHLWPQMIVRPR